MKKLLFLFQSDPQCSSGDTPTRPAPAGPDGGVRGGYAPLSPVGVLWIPFGTTKIMDPWMDPSMDPSMDPWMDPCMDPCMDPWMDPWMDPCMDPWMDLNMIETCLNIV